MKAMVQFSNLSTVWLLRFFLHLRGTAGGFGSRVETVGSVLHHSILAIVDIGNDEVPISFLTRPIAVLEEVK